MTTRPGGDAGDPLKTEHLNKYNTFCTVNYLSRIITVTPGRYNFTINQRATFKKRVILPINLTGHQVYAQIWDAKRRIKYKNIEINVVNAVDGEFDMIIDWQDTTPLKKAAFWDLMVAYADGTRDYWLEGEVTIDIGLTAPEDA